MSDEKKKYKLTIQYDGTHYSGWQVQREGVLSIQALIQKALATVLREKISLIGAGRTDAGVHALGQTAHFSTHVPFEKKRLCHSINSLLPKDIRIQNLEEVPKDFHARYDATGKIYHYHLHLSPVQNPFKRLYALHIPYPLDLPLIKKAAALFVGTHDFTSFANDAKKGAAAKNAVRTIQRLDLVPEENGVRFEFEGNGFLYKMVRNIMGALLEIGTHKMTFEEVQQLFEAKDRTKAPNAAPALGLFLVQVHYPK